MMDRRQERSPLLEALVKYAGSSPRRFHVPWHGGGRWAPGDLLAAAGGGVFAIDATELPGLDDLNSPRGVIAEAQDLAAGAFESDRCFFLTGGSTLGLQALILAAGRPGDKIIIPRNAHRSVIGGLVLAGMDPVFTAPAIVPAFGFHAGIPAREVERAVRNNPDARAVICVHPTYHGAVGDLKKISELARGAGMPLLADEAHGSHMYFSRECPEGALRSGADACVQSLHKTGGSLTQSSLLHIKGPLVDGDRVSSALKIMQTSSPSYILMASLDAARRRLALEGKKIVRGVLEAAAYIRRGLEEIRGVEVFGKGSLDGDGVFGFDPCRLVARVSGIGLKGWEAAGWLMQNHGIYAEMADYHNVILALGPGISREDCQHLVRAVRDLSEREGRIPLDPGMELAEIPPAKAAAGLREAWFASSRTVRLEEARGEISAEWVAVYPPGIPALMPGEEVTGEMVNYLILAREWGVGFQGPADPGLRYLKVINH